MGNKTENSRIRDPFLDDKDNPRQPENNRRNLGSQPPIRTTEEVIRRNNNKTPIAKHGGEGFVSANQNCLTGQPPFSFQSTY
jgi:hypothetical protein